MIFYNYINLRSFIILLAGLYIMFLPALLHAKVIINEIMYDPEGADTGREWIEVYNSGSGNIDLATYKLFESNVNHKLSLISDTGSSILNSGNYAILADNPSKFLIDFPNFTGLLFDSAFSLNNTGEVLIINDSASNLIDKFEYSVDLGAKNNGNSLQRADTGFWLEAKPTINTLNKQTAEPVNIVKNSGTSASSSTSNQASSNNSSTHSSQNDLTDYVKKSLLEIGMGRNRVSTINTPIDFKAEYNTDKNPRFIWNFGDASTEKGKTVSHFYDFPGTYNVILNAFLNGYQATSRIKATILDISVDILYITSGKDVDILLKNTDGKELNLGGFIIKLDSNEFKIPDDTIIDAKSEIIIPAKYTGFEISTNAISTSTKVLKLNYPNGDLYKEEILIPTSTPAQMI